jgi:hypothetical protein
MGRSREAGSKSRGGIDWNGKSETLMLPFPLENPPLDSRQRIRALFFQNGQFSKQTIHNTAIIESIDCSTKIGLG